MNNKKWPMILLISLADNLGLDDEKLPDFGHKEMQTQVGNISTNL
jgi:hypothetical protein